MFEWNICFNYTLFDQNMHKHFCEKVKVSKNVWIGRLAWGKVHLEFYLIFWGMWDCLKNFQIFHFLFSSILDVVLSKMNFFFFDGFRKCDSFLTIWNLVIIFTIFSILLFGQLLITLKVYLDLVCFQTTLFKIEVKTLKLDCLFKQFSEESLQGNSELDWWLSTMMVSDFLFWALNFNSLHKVKCYSAVFKMFLSHWEHICLFNKRNILCKKLCI